MTQQKISKPHWSRILQHWKLLGQPMRPGMEDIHLYRKAITQWGCHQRHESCRVLLLGVTPELRAIDWPASSVLVGCDNSMAMIKALWPDTTHSGAMAYPVCADWRSLPLAARTFDLVIGDGCTTLLPPEDVSRLAHEFDKVLTHGGAIILRLFARSHTIEPTDLLVGEVLAGKIADFNGFRWRLNMVVQGTSPEGVKLADVWDTFDALFPDRKLLSERTGWSAESIAMIDTYRGSNDRYYFHRLDEFSSLLSPVFEITKVDFPGYPLGRYCPIVVVTRR